jgi:hypothetical protein
MMPVMAHSMPDSTRVSRTAAWATDSPRSTAPPGIAQLSLSGEADQRDLACAVDYDHVDGRDEAIGHRRLGEVRIKGRRVLKEPRRLEEPAPLRDPLTVTGEDDHLRRIRRDVHRRPATVACERLSDAPSRYRVGARRFQRWFGTALARGAWSSMFASRSLEVGAAWRAEHTRTERCP